MLKAARWVLCVVALGSIEGCLDPAADKPRAEVVAAQPAVQPTAKRTVAQVPAKPPTAPAAQAPSPGEPGAAAPAAPTAGPLVFSQNGSAIGFTGSKLTGRESGGFAQFEGVVTLAAGAPFESGQVSVVIQMDSLVTPNSQLTTHLKSGDFFLVDKHPLAKFESTAIGKQGGQFKVTGNLSLRGTTKAITFPASINRAGAGVQVKAQFAINRKEFGVVYPGAPDDLIRDEVIVQLNLTAN